MTSEVAVCVRNTKSRNVMGSEKYYGFRLVTLLIFSGGLTSGFEVPKINIEALSPAGIRASIPAVPGIKLFAFHANVNEKIVDKEGGDIDIDVSAPKDGWFVAEDKKVLILQGDTINYWVHVQYNNEPHTLLGLSHKINGSVPSDSTLEPTFVTEGPIKSRCPSSVTEVNRGRIACRGELIFEETFDGRVVDRQKWKVERRLANGDQENPFVSYQSASVSVDGGCLSITPKFLKDVLPLTDDDIDNGNLDLTLGCTSSIPRQCSVDTGRTPDILPPIVSGSITTQESFSFKYGKVEIRAKLPQGDWIYPELHLKPSASFYGKMRYDSGVIRIAFARGNLKLSSPVRLFDNSVLSGGVLLNLFEPCRSNQKIFENFGGSTPWGDDFHTYGIIWDEDSITVTVDGEKYGVVTTPFGGFTKFDYNCKKIPFAHWNKGGPFAPFDKEFFVSIGVGVGGVSDFPDNVGDKPWINGNPKVMSPFWECSDTWNQTWKENKKLLVDYVKVWAL